MTKTVSKQPPIQPSFTRYQRVLVALVVSNLVSACLLLVRFAAAQNMRYWFLVWNVFLGWIPLGLVMLLRKRLETSRWTSWQNIVISIAWLGFLPNSFYIVTDFIHLHPSGEVSVLFDVVLMTSFTFNGFVAGFASLYIMHKLLIKRFRRQQAHAIIAGIIVLCSFAIYLGRDLRWNTWDILINPAGILFDVSERVINPLTHAEVFSTTALFTLLIGSIYIVVWQFVAFLRNE